jgi:YD repeat-containing protein
VYTSGDTKAVYKADGVTIDDTLTNAYTYDSYGNQITKTQTGGGVTLVTHTDYFPNVSAWLVGLPARTWVTDGTNLLTESLNLYDGANIYNTPPTVGIPTATRSWMGGTQYSQSSIIHDNWGNVTAQTTWSGYGTATSAPTTGVRTNYTTYDSIYHTYAIQTVNPLGHTSTVTYNYSLGQPISETDPNGAVTTATFDSFGRFTGLTKPGDSSPTLSVSYQESPYVVTLNQKVDATHTITVVRSYDGLGRQTLTNTNGILVNYSTTRMVRY